MYGIDATALLPVLCPSAHLHLFGSAQPSTAEVRYRKLLAGVQLSRDFFFSYRWVVRQGTRASQRVPRARFTGGKRAFAVWAARLVCLLKWLLHPLRFTWCSWPVHQTAQRTFGQAPEQWWSGGAAAGEAGEGCGVGGAFGSHRVWNEFLSRPLREALAESSGGISGGSSGDCHRWVVPLAHGFFEQRPLALLGRPLTLTLIARRSRQVGDT